MILSFEECKILLETENENLQMLELKLFKNNGKVERLFNINSLEFNDSSLVSLIYVNVLFFMPCSYS